MRALVIFLYVYKASKKLGCAGDSITGVCPAVP